MPTPKQTAKPVVEASKPKPALKVPTNTNHVEEDAITKRRREAREQIAADEAADREVRQQKAQQLQDTVERARSGSN